LWNVLNTCGVCSNVVECVVGGGVLWSVVECCGVL